MYVFKLHGLYDKDLNLFKFTPWQSQDQKFL